MPAPRAKQSTASENASGGLRALVFLILALVAGAAATIMVYQLIQGYKARIVEAQKPEETMMVIVAAGELYPGVTITEQDIVGVEVPKKYLPGDVFNSPELVVGRIPRERILANEFIRPGRLADGDSGIGLNALVPPGMRALSLNLQDGAAVSGFLNPGNRVDILVTLVGEKAGDARETVTLLQTVPIIAVNSRMLKDDVAAQTDADKAKTKAKKPPGRPSVTLAVTPEQAELVAHASRLGPITLTLRSDVDVDQQTVDSINNSDLLGIKEEPKPTPAAPKRIKKKEEGTTTEDVLQIIRGTQKQTYKPPPGSH
jgi:pilus assembly protein CpaB